MPTTPKRSMRLTDEDMAIIARLRKSTGLTATAIVRMGLRRLEATEPTRRQNMTRKDADTLAAQITQDDPQCTVTGTRRYGPDDYSLDVVDTRTGYTFEVRNQAEWDERVRESRLYTEATE